MRKHLFSAFIFVVTATALVAPCRAQVFTVGSFDPRLTPQPYKPTSVSLSAQHMSGRDRQEILRIMQAETAYTMRALPLGHHGVILRANGAVAPDGSDYVKAIKDNGVSIEPGGKALVTDIFIEGDRIVFELNGGPDKKHKFLQHLSVGGPLGARQLQPDEPAATGARVTLVFPHFVPELTGQQVKDLLRPLLDFSIKSPLEAYTDTLPPKIKTAVLEHRVLVGMDREMVLHSMDLPERKVHEKDANGFLFDEWIYGKPPRPVQMVRFMGDRVVRVETAEIGKEPVIRENDETDGYLAGKPAQNVHTVVEGDASPDGSHQNAPTLRKPGDDVPADQPRPVQLPPGTQIVAANVVH